MQQLLTLIAVAGFLAVLRLLGRGLIHALRGGVDAYMAGEIVNLKARRGDVTGMTDAERNRSVARRRRLYAGGAVAFWVVLLTVPPLTPWPAPLYAVYSALWFLPRRSRRS